MTDAILPIIVSSLGTASAFGLVAGYLLRQQAATTAARLTAAEASARNAVSEVADLRDDKVHALRIDLDRHVHNDQSQTVLAELRHLSGQVAQVQSHLGLAREEIAALKAQRASDLGYLENVNKSLQDHKREEHHHA